MIWCCQDWEHCNQRRNFAFEKCKTLYMYQPNQPTSHPASQPTNQSVSQFVRLFIYFFIWRCTRDIFLEREVGLWLERWFMVRWVVRSLLLGGPIELFLFPASVQRLVYKGRSMYYPACGMMHIKEPLLLIGKSSLCGGSVFPLSLSEWYIRLTSYNRKQNVLSASLN